MTKIITKRSKVYIIYLYRWKKYESIPVCRRFPYPPKEPRTISSPAPQEGINWEHHQPNEIIIDWPIYDQYPYFTPHGNTRKPKALRHFQGDTKLEDRPEKGQVTSKNNRRLTAGTFKNYVRSRFPSFEPLPPPCLPLFVFKHPLPHKVRSFWQELPLSPSIYILVKFREKKLIMSTSIFG